MIQVFSNNNFTVRTINEEGVIWFVARDVAQALDYSKSTIDDETLDVKMYTRYAFSRQVKRNKYFQKKWSFSQ